ncbi:hypothetical protein NUW54_g416 [Trametes sanguinea]|uniref:Uncharacterized protein n=1 Tax=Trametes sanguinea TaxID=158606 RepID=A0ACC1QBZ6_9APHY|nr:hypothetical protein NUW54_g416 [Trametes sanguinea]
MVEHVPCREGNQVLRLASSCPLNSSTRNPHHLQAVLSAPRLCNQSALTSVMYLINTTSLTLHRFEKGDKVPHYAILSHVWGDHEQSFQQTPLAKRHQEKKDLFHRMVGYALHKPSAKVKGACAKARADGFEWLWADMSCIDTSNSAFVSPVAEKSETVFRKTSFSHTEAANAESEGR